MYEILDVKDLSKSLKLVKVRNTYLSKARSGQFFILQYTEKPERLPLFVMDTDEEQKSATFLLQKTEDSITMDVFDNIKVGHRVHYIEGPAGKPFEVLENKNILSVSMNWGFGGIYNIAKRLKGKNNLDLAFINTDDIKLYDVKDFTSVFDNIYEYESFEAFDKNKKDYDIIIIAGSNWIARELVNIYEDKLVISAIITRTLCTVGLCLACRINYDGNLKLPCVEGPWLDASKVDFDDLERRHRILKEALEHSIVKNRKS